MKNLLVAALSLCAIPIVAQYSLSKDCNLMRNGDIIIKEQVEYIPTGEKGEDRLWDYSKLETKKEGYKLSYSTPNDTLFSGIEHRTCYRFKIEKDTLFSLGFENQLTYMRDSIAKMAMVYPLSYKQQAKRGFYLKGKYSERSNMVSVGTTLIHADATGTMILPDADTLNNVLRVHIVNDSRVKVFRLDEKVDTVDIKSSDTLPQHKEDIYRWFANGYRYPIFETVAHTYYKNKEPMSHYSTAFYYPPREQIFATKDIKNDSILKQIKATEENDKNRYMNNTTRNNPKRNRDKDNIGDNDIFGEKNSPNILVTSEKIEVTYNIDEITEVEIILSDFHGRIFAHIPKHFVEAGSYREEFSCSQLRPGDYLLCIRTNEDNETYMVNIR